THALFSGNKAHAGNGGVGGGSGAAAGGAGGSGGAAFGAAMESLASTISMVESQLTGNTATGGDGASAGPSLTQPANPDNGLGGEAQGGGLALVGGSFALGRSTLDTNHAVAGAMPGGKVLADGAGGGIYVGAGILNVTNSTLG